jgi:cell division protein FtsW (lipid II flippase)
VIVLVGNREVDETVTLSHWIRRVNENQRWILFGQKQFMKLEVETILYGIIFAWHFRRKQKSGTFFMSHVMDLSF